MIVEARLSLQNSDYLYKNIDIPEILLQRKVVLEQLINTSLCNRWIITEIGLEDSIIRIELDLEGHDHNEELSPPYQKQIDDLHESIIKDGWTFTNPNWDMTDEERKSWESRYTSKGA